MSSDTRNQIDGPNDPAPDADLPVEDLTPRAPDQASAQEVKGGGAVVAKAEDTPLLHELVHSTSPSTSK